MKRYVAHAYLAMAAVWIAGVVAATFLIMNDHPVWAGVILLASYGAQLTFD